MAVGVTPRSRAAIIALLAALLMCVAAGPGAEWADAASPCQKWGNSEPRELSKDQARASVRCLLNQERNSRGLSDLGRDRRLQRASQNHSEYMRNRGCFAHVCQGEQSIESRLRSVSYLTSRLSRWSYGENIAWGEDQFATPRSMVRAWMNSAGHRANILNPTFRDVGVGFRRGTPRNKRDPNGAFFTTDFGLRIG